MTLNTLLEAGPQFDFEGSSKTRLVNKNFKQAKNILNTVDKGEIEKLKTNPYIGIPLIGNFRGLRKLRIGNYRFIYKIDNENLIIVGANINHRKKIYK